MSNYDNISTAIEDRTGYSNASQIFIAFLALLFLAPALLIVAGSQSIIAVFYFTALGVIFLLVNPRVSFLVWIVSISIYYPIRVGGMMVNPSDFAMLLLMLTVILDFLLHTRTELRRSVFDIPFLCLIGAAGLSVFLAFDKSLSLTPILRVITIYLAFRIVYKLAMDIGVRRVLLFFVYQVFALSLLNSILFLIQGGGTRVFGPAWLPFETLAMTALPMTAAFMIWSQFPAERIKFGCMGIVIALAIFATQSRAPIVTVVLAMPVLLVATARQKPEGRTRYGFGSLFKLALPLGLVALILYLGRETFFEASLGRVQELINSAIKPEGTIALRVVLWTAAIKAFLVNPLTGIGIGNFRIVSQILPDIRLTPVWYYIGGMSPHNVVLHWLAETGLPGAGALLWLAWRGLKTGYRMLAKAETAQDQQVAQALFIGLFIFAMSIFYMRAWTWGQDGYIMALLFGLGAAWQRQMASRASDSPTIKE
ncbi:MAG: O-antigen ligase family protein [candidate division Zixibacteria bacterium]|nr:O-antigen ligase family protein [candidate division Zixibacteria bacterium]